MWRSSTTPNRVLLSDFTTSNNLQWDTTNNYLGIGGTPSYTLDVFGTSRFNSDTILTSTSNTTSEFTGAISIPNKGIGVGGDCFLKGFFITDTPVRIKTFRARTALANSGSTLIPIDIPYSKIISINVLVDYSLDESSQWICSTNKSGYQFHIFLDPSSNLKIELTGSSGSILNKPLVATIIYTN